MTSTTDPRGICTPNPKDKCHFGRDHFWCEGFYYPLDGMAPAKAGRVFVTDYMVCTECGQIEYTEDGADDTQATNDTTLELWQADTADMDALMRELWDVAAKLEDKVEMLADTLDESTQQYAAQAVAFIRQAHPFAAAVAYEVSRITRELEAQTAARPVVRFEDARAFRSAAGSLYVTDGVRAWQFVEWDDTVPAAVELAYSGNAAERDGVRPVAPTSFFGEWMTAPGVVELDPMTGAEMPKGDA